MKKIFSSINPQKEAEKIVSFLKKIFQKQKINKAVIGLSGGIDSTVCYCFLKEVLPEKNIYPVHLPYGKPNPLIPKNIPIISIKKIVDEIEKVIFTGGRKERVPDSVERRPFKERTLAGMNFLTESVKIRVGNIMVRVRMIILFDLAKKNNAMVCGTENKSEHLLGYFTRFGDEASDIEPIRHLYKTQVIQLAKYLGVPKDIIDQKPTAGLWQNQTDEGEFGFTYQEADQVLYLFFEEKISVEEIEKRGFKNAQKIIDFALKNQYKHQVPYAL